MTNQLVMIGSPNTGESIEKGDLKEIKVLLQRRNGHRSSDPAEKGEFDGSIIKLKVTAEENRYLKESAMYLEDTRVNPTSCTAQELDQWRRRFTQHWQQVDDIFNMAIQEAGLPSNYNVVATIGFQLV